MTAYIDRIVTEVVVQPDRDESSEQNDPRWDEKQKISAVIKAQDTNSHRLRAEGLDD